MINQALQKMNEHTEPGYHGAEHYDVKRAIVDVLLGEIVQKRFIETQRKTVLEFAANNPYAHVYFGSHVGDNWKERAYCWFLNSQYWGVCNPDFPKPCQSVAQNVFNAFCIPLLQALKTLPRNILSDLEESVITLYQTELGTAKVVNMQSSSHRRVEECDGEQVGTIYMAAVPDASLAFRKEY